jgi:hypothetical protein
LGLAGATTSGLSFSTDQTRASLFGLLQQLTSPLNTSSQFVVGLTNPSERVESVRDIGAVVAGEKMEDQPIFVIDRAASIAPLGQDETPSLPDYLFRKLVANVAESDRDNAFQTYVIRDELLPHGFDSKFWVFDDREQYDGYVRLYPQWIDSTRTWALFPSGQTRTHINTVYHECIARFGDPDSEQLMYFDLTFERPVETLGFAFPDQAAQEDTKSTTWDITLTAISAYAAKFAQDYKLIRLEFKREPGSTLRQELKRHGFELVNSRTNVSLTWMRANSPGTDQEGNKQPQTRVYGAKQTESKAEPAAGRSASSSSSEGKTSKPRPFVASAQRGRRVYAAAAPRKETKVSVASTPTENEAEDEFELTDDQIASLLSNITISVELRQELELIRLARLNKL